MNVTQLQQPPPQSGPPRSASDAEDISPDFLSIRLVNKRTRAKLSPEPLDLTPIPNKGQLFAVAGTLGWFVAIIRSSTGLALVASPLADLRSHLSSSSDGLFQPQRNIPLSSVTPNVLVFALNDSKLVIGLTHGPVIVFEASDICSPGDNEVSPLHTFLPTTPTPTAVRQIYANPGDIPELVAILREPDGSPNSQLVEVVNISTLQSVSGWSAGGTPETFPTSISWSPKGKQLAIALQSGDIITFSPSETQQAKSFVARTPSMQGHSIIHVTWLSNSAFYAIFAPAGPLDPQVNQKHMVIVHDTKHPDASADVLIPINFFPSGVRPPGAFTIALRGWDPARILLLVGDSTTADIGLVCCTSDEKWQRLAFDEGAPSMPLDADQNETTMIGFELDLKNTTSYDVTTSTGETVSVPPPPVVWAYASDGTVTAWYVVNTWGTPYPSMAHATTTVSLASAPGAPAPTTSPFSQAARPAFGQASPPEPSQSSLAFSSAASTFEQPAFGQASAFGQPSSSVPAPSGEGFASFASAPVKWGQSNFGSTVSSFTSAAPPGSPPQIQPSESTQSMSTDSGQELSFSGMSLGEGTNEFGSGSFNLSPGVGAFSKFVPRQASDAPNVPTVEVPKPSPAFGQTGFGAPAFGQSAGQSAFGKTGFGTPMSTTPIMTPVSTTSPSFGSGGAFSTFASGGPATLSSSKPAETKLATPTMSGGGAFGAFASSGPSAFGQVASTTAESVPAWKTGGDATFGSGTGSSVFGAAEPALTPRTTPALSPPTTTSLENTALSPAGATTLTPPSDGVTPSRRSQSPPDNSTAPTSPLTAPDLSKPTVPPESTTPVGPPPAPTAFMNLKMSTGFGLSNFNAKDSPFANRKPVSQTVSAFGGEQPPAPKIPVPATPGSVFGQTSSFGAKPVSAFGQPTFGSPSTPTTAASTAPSIPQTGPSSAFSAFSGIASAFGKTVGSGVSFSDMLRHAGSSSDLKSKEVQARSPRGEEEESSDEDGEDGAEEGDEEGSEEEAEEAEEGAEDEGSDEVGEEGEEEEEGELPESEGEENELPTPAETEPAAIPLPKSRSPSSTPKAERPAINVQAVQAALTPEPEPEPSMTSCAGSTTPPGSPSTAPIQQPTPTLPSPSHSPSPSPSSANSSLARPSTRPLRSSPLANAPVSGGDEKEVKGEKPASLKPRPASPKTPFGKWDGSAQAPSPMPPGPKSPPLLTAKGPPLNNKPTPMVPMQIEFAALYTEVLTEMAALTAFVRDARETRDWRMKPTSGRSSADTLEALTKTIRECSRDIEQLELARNEDNATIRELEIGVLKSKTRKEEIARFDKARSDVEFGKMMKARILSPEQTELQTQLRRDMRSIQDRVTKMEDHLQGSKKKLNEFKTGKPSIKAPSLDTINRTSRNINIAIRQQSADITALSSRVAKLNIEGGSPSSTSSRARERDLVRRPLDVTPHVASTTAAALNAEQAARRLKEALLAVRTEPLLNKQAVNARPALRVFDTPQKPDADLSSSRGSMSGRMFSTPSTLPPLNVSDSAGRGVSPPLGRRTTQKHHAKSVTLKSTPTTGTTTKPSFDWGPLPGIKPMKMIPSDLRSKTG